MTNPIDQRRLRDGAAAEAIGEPDTIETLEKAIEQAWDGVAAMQSLDDLGSPEANNEAMAQGDRLIQQARRYEARLAALRGQSNG